MIGERLRYARQQRERTQKEVAQAAGITSRAYQRMETGDIQPSVERLRSIAVYLEVPLSYILGEEQIVDEADRRLLALFHGLTPEQQKTMLAFGETLTRMAASSEP